MHVYDFFIKHLLKFEILEIPWPDWSLLIIKPHHATVYSVGVLFNFCCMKTETSKCIAHNQIIDTFFLLCIPPTSNLFIDLSVVTSTVTWSKAGNSVFRWKLCLWSNKQILTIGHFIHYGQTSFHYHSAYMNLKDFEEEWISIKFVLQIEDKITLIFMNRPKTKAEAKLQSPLPLDFGWVASVSTGRGAVHFHSLSWTIAGFIIFVWFLAPQLIRLWAIEPSVIFTIQVKVYFNSSLTQGVILHRNWEWGSQTGYKSHRLFWRK